ncbi:protein G6b isoform X2 [Heterocephalus glaber]|uniref:Protein G6b isoform X2 n=1 Tax=Heterocephalus glaber TaxID=10181 RepID=A0AAX6T301_HETGA|nr:protein G6b isoform X2 [Heterocephalus glaber]
MALALRLLALLLSRAGGDPGASLLGRPGDRVNLSCVGVSHPIRWAWAPSFPACQGLSKGRRPILWASTGEIPTVPPPLPFAGRLRSLDPGVRRLELLVSAGDSGNFICKGPQEEESRTLLHVLGDRADCRAPGPARGSGYPQVLIPLLGAGLALGLGALGVVWWLRRRSSPPPLPTLAPFVKGESQRLAEGEEEEPEIPGDLDQEEPSLLYADLDYTALRRPCRLSTVAPADAPTVYAVVV